MTQPSFVPIAEADQVRSARRLRVPGVWTARRPAEIRPAEMPAGRGYGSPGPNTGFAERLVRRFAGQLRLSADETVDDVMVGCAAIAAHRAATVGRAPSIHDVRLPLVLFGFLRDAAPELVAERSARFRTAAQDYHVRRALVDAIPEQTLRMTPAQVESATDDWRALLSPVAPSE